MGSGVEVDYSIWLGLTPGLGLLGLAVERSKMHIFQKFEKWAWSVNFFAPARETTVALRRS